MNIKNNLWILAYSDKWDQELAKTFSLTNSFIRKERVLFWEMVEQHIIEYPNARFYKSCIDIAVSNFI